LGEKEGTRIKLNIQYRENINLPHTRRTVETARGEDREEMSPKLFFGHRKKTNQGREIEKNSQSRKGACGKVLVADDLVHGEGQMPSLGG